VLTRLAQLTTTRPRRVLLITLVAFLVAVVLGGPVAGLLSTGDDFSDPGSENVAAAERLERAAGMEASPSIIALVRPAERAPAVARELGGVEGVARAFTDRTTVSRDGEQAYVAAFLAAGADEDETLDAVEAAVAGERGVTLGGAAASGRAVGDQVSEDLARAELLAFPILFVLSLLVFRGFVAALLPLFVGVLTIFGTFLTLRLVNEATLLSVFALNLTIGLGLGLAIDYSLFMVSRFREELARGLDRHAALRRTMATAGRTVVFSSLTVAFAMLALLVFPQRFLYSMGIAGASAALIAALVSVTALPALLTVLGGRIGGTAPAPDHGLWYRLSHAVLRRPGPVAAATALVLVLAGLPFTGVNWTGVDANVLPGGAAPRVVDETLRAEFAAGRTEPVTAVVTAPRDAAGELRAYAASLDRLPGSAAVAPPRYVGADTWQVDVAPAARPLDDRSLDLVAAVRAADAPGDVQVTGTSARFVDQQAGLGDRLPLALIVLAGTTLILLFLMTGSVVLPVKALVMNLLTLSAAFGLLVLIFQDGRLEGLLAYDSQGGLESTQPLVLLALAFGLSTDYAVFLLTRIKEARDEGVPTDEAVAVGLQRTGRIVTAAAVLFSVAIGAFATSEIIFIKQVGLGTAFAVLIDATIVRALLVPALMGLLGEWNWWAPRPLRRLHARLGISEGGPPPAPAPA
jgi:uncharacterized membrane protein YdfJ with MMPL/SSD domain